jgi:hypothetical protein
MPMSKVAAIITKGETGAAFEVRIASVANQLAGNYSGTEHCARATQLLHDRLNHVFELASVNYQPRPEPIVCMRKMGKAIGVSIMPPLMKSSCGV